LVASTVFVLALVAQPFARAQRVPTPDAGKQPPREPFTGGAENVINSKLLIYAKNGLGTTSTNTGGEFPAKLVESATVNSEFSLQWSRAKPGKQERASLYVAPANSTAWVRAFSVTLSAGETTLNIPYTVTNLAPG